MLSRRLPAHAMPNPWSRLLAERRAAGVALIDLTEVNPTRVGLGGATEAGLRWLGDPSGARYQPDPRGLESARAAVSGYYAARGLGVAPGDLVLTSGTSESYAHLLRLVADPGDAVVVPAPSYPLLEPLAALEGVRLRSYQLVYDGRWHLDAHSLERVIAGARAMVVVQPNHPTGSCLATEELAAAEALCERHGVALISDEVFGDFAWPPRTGGLPSLIGERRVPAFVLSGLSKVCGMPQLKLGWIAVAGPEPMRGEALRGLEWIADLFLSVGTPVQLALPRLLEARHPFQARVRERLTINLKRLVACVERRPELTVLHGEGGWAAVIRVPSVRSEEEWALELLRRNVAVHPGHFYDFEAEGHLVLSLIVEPGVMDQGLSRLEGLTANL